jgi:DNA replication protein DnaC
MTVSGEEIAGLSRYLQRFRLPTMARLAEELGVQGEREGWSCRQYLLTLCEMEWQDRRERSVARLLKESELPCTKTLANLERSWLPEKIQRQLPGLLEGGFLERAENVLCFGLPGRGKTHFLAALGRELVVRHQRRVLFVQAARLMERLLVARRELRLEKELKYLSRFDAVIVDELGYVEYEREQTEVFFQFLNERYESGSILLSSNLVFSQWDRIFKDALSSAAAIDRLVQQSIILEFVHEGRGKDQSIRVRKALARRGKEALPGGEGETAASDKGSGD